MSAFALFCERLTLKFLLDLQLVLENVEHVGGVVGFVQFLVSDVAFIMTDKAQVRTKDQEEVIYSKLQRVGPNRQYAELSTRKAKGILTFIQRFPIIPAFKENGNIIPSIMRLASSGFMFTFFKFMFPTKSDQQIGCRVCTLDDRHVELVLIEAEQVAVQVLLETVIDLVSKHNGINF